MNASPQAIKDAIRAKARALQFDAVGFADPDIDDAGQRLGVFLAAGWQGDMDSRPSASAAPIPALCGRRHAAS
jgi:hypothetical protein